MLPPFPWDLRWVVTSPTAWERIERKYDPEENKAALNVAMLGLKHIMWNGFLRDIGSNFGYEIIKGFSDNKIKGYKIN